MSKCTPVAMPVALDDLLDATPVVRVAPSKVPSRRHLVPGGALPGQRSAPVPVFQANADILESHTTGEDATSPSWNPALSSDRPALKRISDADWSQTPSPLRFVGRRLSDGPSFGALLTLSPSAFAEVIAVPKSPVALPDLVSDDRPTIPPAPESPEGIASVAGPADQEIEMENGGAPFFVAEAPTAPLPVAPPQAAVDAVESDAPPAIPSWVAAARDATPLPWSPAILLGALLALRDCALWSWVAVRRVRPFSPRRIMAALWALACPLLLASLAYIASSDRPLSDQVILIVSVSCLAPMVAGLAWAATMALVHAATRLTSSLVARGRRFVA